MGDVFFRSAVDEGMGVRGIIEGHSGPGVFGQTDVYGGYLGVVGEEVIGQVKTECFDGMSEMIFCQRVYRIFHRVGGQHLAVVTDGMHGVEITFQGYVDGDMTDVMTVGTANYLRQLNGIFAICVLI